MGFSPWDHRVVTERMSMPYVMGHERITENVIQILKIYQNFNGQFNEVRYLLFLLRCLFSHLGKISHPDLL